LLLRGEEEAGRCLVVGAGIGDLQKKRREEGSGVHAPRQCAGEVAVTEHKLTVANGNRTIRGRSHRNGVTSDEAENAPRLRV
jgi:hypothetical protein